MSRLNVRHVVDMEITNDEDSIANLPDITQQQNAASENSSDDIETGFPYLVPNITNCTSESLTSPTSSLSILPKTEIDESKPSTSDRMDAEYWIAAKLKEGSVNTDDVGDISSQVLNEIRPVHQSDISGYEKDRVQEMQLASLGLPTSFIPSSGSGGFGNITNYLDQRTMRKGHKVTYECQICPAPLSSEETALSHIRGVKHIKKKIAMETKNEKLRIQGIATETKVVQQVPNPIPLQKKVPIRLVEKLRECTEPIVGLDSITEVIACSNPEVEPYYECLSCGTKGEANCMYNHLVGKKHRKTYLEKRFPYDSKYQEMNHRELNLEIQEYNENTELNRISTIYSDEMFPWAAGKAPWSIEKGGTGSSIILIPE